MPEAGFPAGLSRAANKRGVARLAAVQALYQMDLTSARLIDVAGEFESFRLGKEVDPDESDDTYREADPQWFRAILAGVVADQKKLDPLIARALPSDWPLSRIETLLRAILRAGSWELTAKSDVPARVIINEYLDVTRAFFEEDEYKLVNAVLDRIARKSRPSELSGGAGEGAEVSPQTTAKDGPA